LDGSGAATEGYATPGATLTLPPTSTATVTTTGTGVSGGANPTSGASSSNGSGSSSGLSGGAIAGIIIGALVVLALFGVLLFFLLRRTKDDKGQKLDNDSDNRLDGDDQQDRGEKVAGFSVLPRTKSARPGDLNTHDIPLTILPGSGPSTPRSPGFGQGESSNSPRGPNPRSPMRPPPENPFADQARFSTSSAGSRPVSQRSSLREINTSFLSQDPMGPPSPRMRSPPSNSSSMNSHPPSGTYGRQPPSPLSSIPPVRRQPALADQLNQFPDFMPATPRPRSSHSMSERPRSGVYRPTTANGFPSPAGPGVVGVRPSTSRGRPRSIHSQHDRPRSSYERPQSIHRSSTDRRGSFHESTFTNDMFVPTPSQFPSIQAQRPQSRKSMDGPPGSSISATRRRSNNYSGYFVPDTDHPPMPTDLPSDSEETPLPSRIAPIVPTKSVPTVQITGVERNQSIKSISGKIEKRNSATSSASTSPTPPLPTTANSTHEHLFPSISSDVSSSALRDSVNITKDGISSRATSFESTSRFPSFMFDATSSTGAESGSRLPSFNFDATPPLAISKVYEIGGSQARDSTTKHETEEERDEEEEEPMKKRVSFVPVLPALESGRPLSFSLED